MTNNQAVKVLYTFDDDNKTNCLARLPNALPIPVVALDETTQIGVVELKICIQAIVASRYNLLGLLAGWKKSMAANLTLTLAQSSLPNSSMTTQSMPMTTQNTKPLSSVRECCLGSWLPRHQLRPLQPASHKQ